VNGTCLSVIGFDDQSMSFDVIPETWAVTNLGSLQASEKVNLERALAASGRFEGHMMQGHIESTATVLSLEKPKDSPWATLTIDLPDEISKYVVHKGSIAINGVSLTVAKIDGGVCKVELIPHTLSITNLGLLKNGDTVNIETDVLARYIESILAKRS
jgi:riboflavin synthase